MQQSPETGYPDEHRTEFIGRVQEQRHFLVVLGGLLAHHQRWFELAKEHGTDFDPDIAPADNSYANIFLPYGIGGIGKSWLTRRCLDLAQGIPYDLPILTLYEDVSYGAPVLEPVHLLDRLAHRLDQFGYGADLAGYHQAQADLPHVVDRVTRFQFEHRDQWDNMLRIATEMAARGRLKAGYQSFAETSLAFTHASGAEVSGSDAPTLAKAYDLLLEKMQSQQAIEATDVALFRNPPAALAAQLVRALTRIVSESPLVIGLDNLEFIVSLEPLIRDCLVIPTNHAPLIWILSGRYNLADERVVVLNGEQQTFKGYRDLLGRNPPVVWDMSIFGDADLREYLQAESERRRSTLVVDEILVEAVKSTSSGVPLVVEMVADALFTMDRDEFLRDFALDDRKLLPGDRLARITARFLRYCVTEAEDLERVQAMAILRKGASEQALAAVWQLSGDESVPDTLSGLRARYAFVLSEGLHDAVYEFTRRQLRTSEPEDDVRETLSRRAVSYYQTEWQELQERFEDPTLRVRDPNWQRATRDLVNALLWHAPDEAVMFLLPRFVEGLGFDRPFANGLLIQAEEFLMESVVTFSQSYANLLHRMRMGLQDIEWVFDEPAEAIGVMVELLLHTSSLDPLHLSILHLWQGNWLAENGRYETALSSYDEARQHRPDDAAGLGRQLGKAFYELSSRFLWPDPATEPVSSEQGLRAAQRSVELDPDLGAGWFNLGVALDYSGQLEESLPAYERATEIEPRPVHFNNLGDVYSALGRDDEAEAAYENAVQLDPSYAWPYHSLGQLYVERGDYEMALESYQQAIDHHQQDKDRGISWDGFGDAQAALGDYDEAIAAYRWAGVLHPTYAPPWHGLGNAYSTIENFIDAVEAYQKAIELDPGHARSYHNLGLIYAQQGEISAAIDQFQQALDHHLGDQARAESWARLGDAFTSVERHRDAIEAYQQALKLDPDQADALNNLGDAYQATGRSSDAVEAYRQAIELDPDLPTSWNGLANLLTAQGQYDEAISAYERVIKLDPDYAWPYNNLGFICGKQRQYEAALDYYQQAIERHQAGLSKAVSWSNLGDIHVGLGDREEAIRAYQEAILLAPDYAWAYHNLAGVYETFGDKVAALGLYQQAIERHNQAEDRAVSWCRLADVYRQLEHHDQAVEAYNEVLALQPEHIRAWNGLGDVYLAMAGYDQATDAYRKAIESDPEFGLPYHNLGLISSEHGDHDSALTLYQEALERHTNKRDLAASWNKLGDTHVALGDSAEAAEAYQQAIEFDSTYAWPYHSLATIHVEREAYETALTLYEQAIERHRLDTDRALSWDRLGNVYKALGRVDDAIEAFGHAGELDPNYVTPWHNLGDAYQSKAQYNDAISAYLRAIELEPTEAQTYYKLGLVYEALDEYESAIKRFQQAIELFSEEQKLAKSAAWYHRGKAQRGLERPEAAVDAYWQSIRYAPDNVDAWQEIGATFTSAQRYREAIDAYQQALNLDPAAPEPWNSLGNVHRLRKRYQKATDAYQQAIVLDPDFAWPYHNLGQVDQALEKFASATTYFQQAIERHQSAPAQAVSWDALGNVHRVQAQYEQALAAYRQAIELDPGYAHSYHGLGLVYCQLGRYDPAIALFEQSIEKQASDSQRAAVWKDLGDAFAFSGRWDQAIEAFQTALARDDAYSRPWFGLGNVYRSTGRYEDGIRAYRQAIDLEPSFAWAYNNLGLIYEQQGRYDQALDLYEQAIERHEADPDKAVSCYNSGDAYRAQNEYSQAIEAYQQAIFLDPTYARPWNGLGDAYRAQANEKEAAETYQRAIELEPGFALPYHNLGMLSYESRSYARAVSYFQQALERRMSPLDQAVSWNALGNAYRAMARNDQAIEAYQQAVKANPDDAWPYHNLGFVYKTIEAYHEAITSYQRAIERHADDTNKAISWNNLGNVYNVLDRHEDAIQAYQSALDLNAGYALPWNSLGEIYSRRNQVDEAIDAFRHAIEHDPDNNLAWNNLGDIYRQSGRFDEAIEAYERAIKLDSSLAWPYHNLGLVYEERGDFESATKNYLAAIERHEDNEQEAVLWDNVGSIYRLMSEDEKAIEAYRRAAVLDPDYVSPWYNLGNIYAAQEQDDDAITAFRHALDLGPRDPWPYHNLGLVYEKLERFSEAIALYQQAIERHSNDLDRAVSWGGLGAVYGDAGRYDEATEAFQEAIRLSPKYAHPWNSLGDIYGTLGDYRQAVDAYRMAIELDPDYAWPYNNLGLIYENLGQYEQAIGVYRDVIGRHSNDSDRAISWNSLGDVYSSLHREDEAITAYEEAIRLDPDYAWPYSSLGAIYERRGDRDQAYTLYQQATRRHRQRSLV